MCRKPLNATYKLYDTTSSRLQRHYWWLISNIPNFDVNVTSHCQLVASHRSNPFQFFANWPIQKTGMNLCAQNHHNHCKSWSQVNPDLNLSKQLKNWWFNLKFCSGLKVFHCEPHIKTTWFIERNKNSICQMLKQK